MDGVVNPVLFRRILNVRTDDQFQSRLPESAHARETFDGGRGEHLAAGDSVADRADARGAGFDDAFDVASVQKSKVDVSTKLRGRRNSQRIGTVP